MESLIQTVKDNNLKLTLSFGIALHHAGLHERDRKIAEELFVNQKIQVRCRYTGVKKKRENILKPSWRVMIREPVLSACCMLCVAAD